ncbi:hypothetical protein Ciccas_010622 [Cichlidogyrus casuarinus]|uniref:methenyltetrahydrofolate cyclohydrolase n=1 Tax=Cichlidogyrus casuarinus TaxID=1844966 RepID=A0ABD2PTN2_9PLAT
MNEGKLVNMVKPEKDVDGLTDQQADVNLVPCTALACLDLIKSTGISSLKGQPCTVIGRGRLAGAPIAKLLREREQAVVTVCHSQTGHLATETRTAKVLISAVGKLNLIRAEHVSPDCVVIDCGITVTEKQLADGRRVRRVQGDVDFAAVSKIASHITPVPGGVGPMTVAMLFRNTLYAAIRQLIPRLQPRQRDLLTSILTEFAHFSFRIEN